MGCSFSFRFPKKGESMQSVEQVQRVPSVSEKRSARRIASKILKILDDTKYRLRGFTNKKENFSLTRKERLVTIKRPGHPESLVRLDPSLSGKMKLRRNIDALETHLLKDGILLSYLIQVL